MKARIPDDREQTIVTVFHMTSSSPSSNGYDEVICNKCPSDVWCGHKEAAIALKDGITPENPYGKYGPMKRYQVFIIEDD